MDRWIDMTRLCPANYPIFSLISPLCIIFIYYIYTYIRIFITLIILILHIIYIESNTLNGKPNTWFTPISLQSNWSPDLCKNVDCLAKPITLHEPMEALKLNNDGYWKMSTCIICPNFNRKILGNFFSKWTNDDFKVS